jgi:hypothetical protein
MSETHLTDLSGITVPTRVACALLSVTQPGLAKLEAAGYVTRVGPNRWPLVGLAQGRFRSLRDETKRDAQTTQLTRIQTAKARGLERKNQIAEGKLVDVEEMLNDTQELIGPFMAVLESIPAQCTRDLALRAVIKEKIDAARTWAADRAAAMGAKYAAKAEKG